jgi:PAS domain S-box-containing protein
VIGVLGLAYTDPDQAAGEARLELVRRVGELAAITLDNARLYARAARELAERARAERELAAAEARYRALLEQIPAVAYSEMHELGGSWQYVSPQIESLLDYTPEEVGQPSFWKTLVHPDDRERVLAEDELCERTGKPWRIDYRIVARDGRVIWIRDHAVLVREAHGRPSYWQGLFVDVTEQKLAEQALTDALERERQAAARLRALDEMKNTFLDAVSHELRTPLAAVMGIALTLQRAGPRLSEPDTADLLERLVTSAGKLDRLLTDLLDLDRLSRGIVAPKLSSTDVTALVTRVGEEWRSSSRRWLGVDAEPVVARVDPGKVERIVENLLANAARHTPEGTPVWLRLSRQPPGVLIAVEDAGAGVPAELRASVFEPFRQGPDAPTHAPGVGIGLSLVARFAELHGGRAWVEERDGGGSSFRVLLPDAG